MWYIPNLFKYSLQTTTDNFKGLCHRMSVLLNTQKHQPHITLKTKSKSIFSTVPLCYLPLLDRENHHQIEPDLKFLSSYKMHQNARILHWQVWVLLPLHLLAQADAKHNTISNIFIYDKIQSYCKNHLISFIYEKFFKFTNIKANYQKQCSIHFHLECKQKPKTNFFFL
jgi:hypothetical protein